MIRPGAAVALVAISLLIGGCVAAAIPIAVGGYITREKVRDHADPGISPAPAVGPSPERVAHSPKGEQADQPTTATVPQADANGVRLATGLTALPPPRSTASAGRAGEDAASSLQAYQALWRHLSDQIARRTRGEPLRSVVLDADAALDAPRFVPCEGRPLAVVFDLDENASSSVDPDARWRRWRGDGTDDLIAVPGAVDSVEAARREGVTVMFSSARSPTNSAAMASALTQLGFGPIEPERMLHLRGSQDGDAVRQAMSTTHCVIAIVGDELGDFSDLFDAADNAARRPTAATETMVAPLWGAGWFLLPNPVRSTATSSTATSSNAPSKE